MSPDEQVNAPDLAESAGILGRRLVAIEEPILAAAGLNRLGRSDAVTEFFEPDVFVARQRITGDPGIDPDHPLELRVGFVKTGRNGTLVRMLPKYRSQELNLYAIYPSRQYLDAKIKTWVEYMRGSLPEILAAHQTELATYS